MSEKTSKKMRKMRRERPLQLEDFDVLFLDDKILYNKNLHSKEEAEGILDALFSCLGIPL